MLIRPSSIVQLEVFQINPTTAEATTRIAVRAIDGEELAASAAVMPPLGSRRIVWDARQLGSVPYVYLTSDRLTAPNAKPLVFLHFRGGAFSAAHS